MMGNKLDKVIPEDEQQTKSFPTPTGCAYCSEKVRLVSFKQLQPGAHICQGGQNSMRYMNGNQKYLYTHHAIVKKVECLTGTDTAADITFIHYNSTPYDAEVKIRETIEKRDLRIHEMYIVRYRYTRFQPDQVLERARKVLDDDPEYSLSSLNCEHFCTWCITGEERSCQVDKVKEIFKNILDSVLGSGSKVARLIIQFAGTTADDVANVLDKLARNSISLGATALSVVAILVYLIRNIAKHVMIYKKFKKGHICKGCCNFEVRSIWLSFIMFFLPTIGSILVGLFVTSSGPLAGILVPLSFLLLIMVWGSNKFYKTVRSPFRGDKKRVVDMQDVHEGDVIQYPYPNMLHEAIVSSVGVGNCSKIGKVHVVHYGKKTLFSKREIIEEELEIDLNKMKIYNLDYSCYNVHEREEVVRRARQRVGEKKFGFFNNRSCHFCHWAKVNEGFDAVSTSDIVEDLASDIPHFPYQISKDQSLNHPPSTSLMDKAWVKINSEVSEGDPIEFRYRGHWHKGICTQIASTETARDLQINVVHYSYHGPFDVPEVREEGFSFDLSVDNVYVYNYHPAHRYSRAEIIDRARRKIGEKKYSMLYRNSGHLVEEITLKEREEVINSPNELCEGDIISFCYYGRRQAAVLVSIVKVQNDTKCDMNVIHYAKSRLLATRTVLEENISIDLAKNNLRKVNFAEYYTYPGYVVVERAKQILDEQRFNRISNNSNHLVHWAKVDKRRKDIHFVRMGIDLSLQLDIMDDKQNKTSNQDVDIVPFNIMSKKEKMHLYMELIRTWDELIPGHIVEFKYYCIWHQGILTEVNIRQEIIKVIHYGAEHLFATRTIMEEERKVNLKKENLYIYHPDPEYASSSAEVIGYARSKLGKQKWGSGNRSSDFCRECVFGRNKLMEMQRAVQVE